MVMCHTAGFQSSQAATVNGNRVTAILLNVKAVLLFLLEVLVVIVHALNPLCSLSNIATRK